MNFRVFIQMGNFAWSKIRVFRMGVKKLTSQLAEFFGGPLDGQETIFYQRVAGHGKLI